MPIQACRTLFAVAILAGPCMGQEIRARVGFENPERQFLQVELQLHGFQGGVDLLLPVWTPGSYKVRDYSQYIEDFGVLGPGQVPVAFTKVAKNRWRIETAANVTVHYQYFAAETSVRHCYLDGGQAFLMPGSLLPYVEGALDRPYEVQLEVPAGWSADTSLEEVRPFVFRARDYDELVDSPIQVGTHQRHDFEVDGTAFRLTLTGDTNMDGTAMAKDMARVVRQAGDMFGGFPFDRYLFLVRFDPPGGGGLEHANSTALMTGAYRFDSKSGWEGFLGLVAHEFFHAWNVKRIRDEVLGPFDYTKEVYTRLLWVHEGWTSYYGPLLLRRAGISSESELLRSYERLLNGYKRRPGRLVQSLAQSSFDSWIKYYQTTATSHNSTVDYYGHGRLAALCLDLILRDHSGNERGLDDVLVRLWQDYAVAERGFREDDLYRILVELGGSEAAEFWNQHVIAAGDIDLARYLAYAGLEWTARKNGATRRDRLAGTTPEQAIQQERAHDSREGEAEKDGDADEKWEPWKQEDPPHLGFTTTLAGNSLVVRSIERGGTAWQDGLATGDELIAVAGRRITQSNWNSILRGAREQGALDLTLSRSGRLQTVRLRLQGHRPDYKLSKAKEPDKRARAIYESLFNAPFSKDSDAQKNKQDEAAGASGTGPEDGP